MSLFLGSTADAPSSKNIRIVIENAKDNFKYRFGKPKAKYQRRVRDPDVENFHDLAKEFGVNMGYDGTCDTIWFETSVEGQDIVLSGRDTGGQFIRSAIQIAINTMPHHEFIPVVLAPFLEKDRFITSKKGKQVRKSGKSNMLIGVQMRMWSMNIGDTIFIEGGDPLNTDALDWDKHTGLFKIISDLFGYNYTLENKAGEDGIAKFILTREADTEPVISEINCDIHTADQLLMAIIGHRKISFSEDGRIVLEKSGEKRTITLTFPLSRDYHPNAAIYILEKFGFTVEDSKAKDMSNDDIDEGVERTVIIYID